MKHLIILVLFLSTNSLYAGTAGIADGEKLLTIAVGLILLMFLGEKLINWVKAYRLSKREPDVIDGDDANQ